eukprot:TRINITY_DN5538_c0_g1_i5.p1 TRINITY_DN5538_c0_g1~~TRINITY_DN5538_c0_g1_i5.p1  ORF type:complete len:496 (+),score=97.07 TRINITY_DN5538_c0_g1_i5:862-2349(+)
MDQMEQLEHMEKEKDLSRHVRVEKRLSEYIGRGDSEEHWNAKALSEMTVRDWRIFKEDHSIVAKGGGIPNPIRSWSESGLPESLQEAIMKAGYEKPTPIQMAAIPLGLQHRDIMGLAEAGSGKTAAFVLPMLVFISSLPKMTLETEADGPYALIMAPARELAQQIEAETRKFAAPMGIRVVSIVGGESIEEQGFALQRGCEVLIATPGRLNDCLDRRYIVLNQCNYVVLDEADKMVDMGFEQQVLNVLEAMPAGSWKSTDETEAEAQERAGKFRLTHMYSATMPLPLEKMARRYLRRPATVTVGEVGHAVERIEQRVEWVKGEADKKRKLVELLYTGIEPPIIVFTNQKKSCDSLAKALDQLGFKCAALHAGKSQDQRRCAMSDFKQGKHDILVATDVAGRGIDVKGVTHVVNYDLPKEIGSYTQRIGRTGRAGMTGTAVSFITADDTDIMYDLTQMLMKEGYAVPRELLQHPASRTKPGAVPDRKPRRDTVIYS